MRAADIEKFLVRASGATPSEIDQRTRWLRNFEHPGLRGLRAGRGRHAPHLDQWEAATMLLCLAARRATDAKDIALWLAGHRLTSLRLRGMERTGGLADLLDCIVRITGKDPTEVDFVYILGLILSYAGIGMTFNIDTIEMSDVGVYAWITFTDGSAKLFLCDEKFLSTPPGEENPVEDECAAFDTFLPTDIERKVLLSGRFIRTLGKKLLDGKELYAEPEAK